MLLSSIALILLCFGLCFGRCFEPKPFPIPTSPSNGNQMAARPALECEVTRALGPEVLTATLAGVPGVALTEHRGACAGAGDTEHADATAPLNPLPVMMSTGD